MSNIQTTQRATTILVSGTGPRRTPQPASSRFHEVLEGAAGAALSGARAAAGVVPGAGIVTAAVDQAASAVGGGGGLGSSGNSNVDDILRTQADDNMRLLAVQAQISEENQRFSTLSNVMKARHETAKTAIGNIR